MAHLSFIMSTVYFETSSDAHDELALETSINNNVGVMWTGLCIIIGLLQMIPLLSTITHVAHHLVSFIYNIIFIIIQAAM